MLKESLVPVKEFLTTGKRRRLLVASSLCIGLAGAMLLFAPKASAAADTAPVWTVTMLTHYNKAVEAYNRSDWGTAKDNFRMAIGDAAGQDLPELWEGLLNTCMHSEEWDQVALACEKLGAIDPVAKNQVAFEYGMALYKLNRYQEAVPVLKRALMYVDQPLAPPYRPTKKGDEIIAETNPNANPVVNTNPHPVVVAAPKVEAPKIKVDAKDYLNYENAIHSELILLATYEGCQKTDDPITWNNPPNTNWKIVKILKGPPQNPHIYVRYEFHDNVNRAMPKDWHYDEKAMMPQKGSEWIIFIEFAFIKRGAYETYQGSYGRQMATDANLNELYAQLDAHNMREQKAE
jgi:tetratricopeptide (TPR) repeat protein